MKKQNRTKGSKYHLTPDRINAIRRIGFMEGQFEVPDDIDTMFAAEIEEMFYGGSLFPDEDVSLLLDPKGKSGKSDPKP
jgi:hypothetical protein